MITKIISEIDAEEVPITEVSIDTGASRSLGRGCSQRIAQIEPELDDLDSTDLIAALYDNRIDSPEYFDLYDIFAKPFRSRFSC
jgi:hypothetical protein